MTIIRSNLSKCLAVLSVCSVAIAASSANAWQVNTNEQQAGRQQTQQEADRLRQADEVRLPDCLHDLMLTSQQQVKVREVVRKTNEEMIVTWQRFSQTFMASVQTEALLAAAIEDHLTDAQRKQVRELRQKTMQSHRVTFERGENWQQQGATAKDAGDSSIRGNRDNDQPQSQQGQIQEQTPVVQEELTVFGVALTSEQIAAADQMQERYMTDLRAQNREIASLHLQLVCLEAHKLEEIELLLTSDQLRQLRENRKTGPSALARNRGR
jgi:hypothetical protein